MLFRSWSAHTASAAIAGGPAPRSAAQRSLGGSAFYQVYCTSDGQHIVLGGREIKFALNLLTALGRADLIPLAEAEAGQQDELIAFLRQTFAERTREQWTAWMADKDVAFAPVLDFREALDAPHVAARGLIVQADGRHHIAPPIRFANDAPWQPGKVPELDG